jgi:Zn-dependent membrane protease YugP
MYFGDTTFFLLIPAIILALYAQARVKGTYARYSKVMAQSGMTGAEAARSLLNSGGAGDVPVERIAGQLTDNYDPRKKVLRLSEGVYDGRSLAALGIAAHETGHALQHHNRYAPLQFRNGFFPVANIGSALAFPLFFIGLLTSSRGPSILMDIGILLFTAAVMFSVVTLPVEFNASKRAVHILETQGLLNGQEIGGARKVLSAAALTYVAATTMAILQLVRLLMIRGSRD